MTGHRLRRLLGGVLSARAARAGIATVAGGILAGGLALGPAVTAGAAPSGATRAGQLVTESWAAAAKARSLTVMGILRNGHQTIVLDLTDIAGGDSWGSVTESDIKVRLVQVGQTGYVKAGRNFWKRVLTKSHASYARQFAGRWIEATGDNSPITELDQFTSLTELLTGLEPSGVTWDSTARTKYHRHPVYELRGKVSGRAGSLLIAATGAPYPLEIMAPAHEGSVRFSHWNAKGHVPVPRHALDIDKLVSGS